MVAWGMVWAFLKASCAGFAAAVLVHVSLANCQAQARQGAEQSLEVGEWTTEVASRSPVATDARRVGDSGGGHLPLTTSRTVRARVFPAANPPRVTVDRPAVEPARADSADVEAAKAPHLDPQRGSGQEARPTSKHLKAKPVVMIDPGHGGLDPGAVGAGGLLEKHLVMAVSQHLRAILVASGRYRVLMTRNSDIFVSLDQRLRLTRRYGADLFVSIHADAVGTQDLAPNVRGATVYTLSEQASDGQARRLAEKENAVDVLGGLVTGPQEARDDVRSILIDLWRQETANLSADFQTLLIGGLRKRISLAREPQRSAAFKVLKQAHSPAVLIELGYMSNDDDQKLMKSVGWQTQVAGTIAAAIDAFFARRLEDARP
jgi:N-acetylmuramoyl-L-alanine amidase